MNKIESLHQNSYGNIRRILLKYSGNSTLYFFTLKSTLNFMDGEEIYLQSLFED
jgi:hypothetical protein